MPVVRSQGADDAARQAVSAAAARRRVHSGLRAHLNAVYLYMCLGMLLTATSAWCVAQLVTTSDPALAKIMLANGQMLNGFGELVYFSPLRWVVILLPIPIAVGLAAAIDDVSRLAAAFVFCIYALLIGISISIVFLIYAEESIAQVFLITAITFAALSLWGYTTGQNLTGLGSFLIMGVIGLIVALAVNIFLQSSIICQAASLIGVLVFAGLTAFDTQKIKTNYLGAVESGSERTYLRKSAITDALLLFLDFVNIFMFFLYFFGSEE
jgi:FtsH-binding integral membrane protein